MLGVQQISVANVWLTKGEIIVRAKKCNGSPVFRNVADWIEHKLFEDMCDICNGSVDDHYPGCPNDWPDSWDY